ncbi:MAG: NAD-dependent epimerase/dehydratase family protein [Rugosibacter sp.]
MAEWRVGVLGASSLVGGCVLRRLRAAGGQVVAYSRQVTQQVARQAEPGVWWRSLPPGSSPQPSPQGGEGVTPLWICVAPIWVLPDYFSLIEASGARRVVALSSTSRFTKVGAGEATALQGGQAKNALLAVADGDTAENAVAARLIESEARVQAWAEQRGIAWVVLRPTLIYGLGRDKNISEIARFIRRFGFFPLLGQAQGLRQPIHAEDVAAACVAALQAPEAVNRAYNISGGETLPYREMVARVFKALGRPVRLVAVPLWAFRWAVAVLRCLPRYRHWSAAMAERMNRDLVFDHAEATRDLGFKPRGFALTAADVPQ